MAGTPWSDEENDLIVKDYFEMFRKELEGGSSDADRHRIALGHKLNDRSRKSIQFKHCNISAVLKCLGQDWMDDYRPLHNYQGSLEGAVSRWLHANPEWMHSIPSVSKHIEIAKRGELVIETPPTYSNQPPPKDLEQVLSVARRCNVAEKAERNRELGRLGEEIVFEHEKSQLQRLGCSHLAKQVKWISRDEGDGAGYDILSYRANGAERLIEVKTTNGWEWTPFYITRNELRVSEDRKDEWSLMRLWNVRSGPRAFELHPPLKNHLSLAPQVYEARLNG